MRSTNPKGSQHESNKLDVYTDTILFYNKSIDSLLNYEQIRIPLKEDEFREKYHRKDEKGLYYDAPIICSPSMGERPNLVYEYKGYMPPPYGWREVLLICGKEVKLKSQIHND